MTLEQRIENMEAPMQDGSETEAVLAAETVEQGVEQGVGKTEKSKSGSNAFTSMMAGAAVLGSVMVAEGKDFDTQTNITAQGSNAAVETVKAAPALKKMFEGKRIEAYQSIDKTKVTDTGTFFSDLAIKVGEAEKKVTDGTSALAFAHAAGSAFGRKYQEVLKNRSYSKEDCLVIAKSAQDILDACERACTAKKVHLVNIENEKSYYWDAVLLMVDIHKNMTESEKGPEFKF